MTDVGVHDRLIVIVGPTASGKSSLALELAGDLGGELVSADSVQVYRGLDIGSAKPSKTVQAATPHHLINVLDPREQSDAAWWAAAADDAISAIRGRGNRPIVVGGTGLYIRALLRGLVKTPTVDTAIRDALETELDALGPQALHARLKLVDPTTATRLAPADAQRVIRALSVFEATGRALSAWHAEDQPSEPRYRAHLIELDAPRAWLDPRIATRAHAMVEGGMIAETARLIADGVPDDAPGLSTLGYRAVVAYLAAGGEGDRAPLTEAIAAGHRKYAKRQRTWLRGIGKANITEEHGYTSIVPDENRLAVVRRALRLE